MPGVIRNFRYALAAAIAGVLAATATAWPAAATELRITVTAVRSGNGNMHVSVYDRPETFPKSDGMLREMIVKAEAPMLELVVPDLPPGSYAVAAFHDENGNREFDTGFLGIPLEDYAFSNDPTVIFSAPDFEAAKFAISGDVARIAIRMKR